MSGPLVVEVLRGTEVESRHEVDVVAVDEVGRVLWSRGDGARPVLPRSSLKPVQALPLVRSGAADAHAASVARLALSCASHGGEPAHVAEVDTWLADLGCTVADLECGAHPPTHRPSADALVAAGGQPSVVHNTCSGKHAGFLSVCRHVGLDPSGYRTPGHPLQDAWVTPATEDACGISLAGATPGTDGCGIPVWTMPLDRLAAGWASLGGHEDGRRILAAMMEAPFMVGGTDRACTRIMEAAAGRAAVKTGAEGVYCGLAIESGVAVALKVRDGATRASEPAIEWAMAEVGAGSRPRPEILRNAAGTTVGEIRIAD